MASPALLSVMDTPFCQTASVVSPDMASQVSVLVKDASKRKRVNRNAKLKQCKLDARREQWLSQVTLVKHGKGDRQEPSSPSTDDLGEIVHPEGHGNSALRARELHRYISENRERALPHSHLHILHSQSGDEADFDKDKLSSSGSSFCTTGSSEAGFSPKSLDSESPKSKVTRVGGKIYGRADGSGESETQVKDDGPGSLCKSETSLLNEYVSYRALNATDIVRSTVDSYVDASLKVKDRDFESEDDDWEAAADALGLNHIQDNVPAGLSEREEEKGSLSLDENLMVTSKPSSNHGLISRSASAKAWRQDDVHRPASLPILNKQQSLPTSLASQSKQCVHVKKVLEDPVSGPSLCPICAEELDTTDSSFEPCECGFQLCLFCHHRIVSDDGRCPGCRRFYNSALRHSSCC